MVLYHLITRQVSSQPVFLFKKFNIDFLDGGHGIHHGFTIRPILARSTRHLDTSSEVSSQFAFLLRRKNRNSFPRWRSWRSSWISDLNNFNWF